MSLLLIFSIMPILGLLYLRDRNYYAFHLSALYIFPLVLFTMLGSEGALPGSQISQEVANYFRVGTHALFFAGTSIAVVVVGKLKNTPIDGTLTLIGLAAISSVALSIFLTGTVGSFEQIARLGVMALLLVNILILHPVIVKNLKGFSFELFSDYIIAICIWMGVLSIIAIVIYGNFPDWQIRLGRPLNPRVFAAFQVVAFIICVFQRRSLLLILFFGGTIIASGARTALLAIAITLFYRYRHQKVLLTLAAIPALVIFIWVDGGASFEGVLSADVFARTDWSSGRLEMWGLALSLMPDYWTLGTGERFIFVPLGGQGEPLRLHNGLFESILSYGVLFAASQAALYLTLISRTFGQVGRDRGRFGPTHFMFKTIVVYVISEWMFGTMYWTNLGDGFSLLILALVPLIRWSTLGVDRVQQARRSNWNSREHPSSGISPTT